MRRAALLALGLATASARADVLLNEIAFDATGPDWVELYNAGTAAVSLDGWVLSDVDTAAGNEIVLSPGVPFPAGAFLTVRIDAAGTDDLDFSDGSGEVYSGTSTTVNLAVTEDEVALYRGVPLSSATLADFAAWVTDGVYDGTPDQAHAAAAGIWPAGEAVAAIDAGADYALGRRADGVDTNLPEDFALFRRPTPGSTNAPPPPPSIDPLFVPPGQRAFAPDDPDPSRRTVRLYFNAGAAEAVKNLRVFDAGGRTVRWLIRDDRGPAGDDLGGLAAGSVEWDGVDEGGRRSPMGVYLVLFEARDPAGVSALRGRAAVAVGRAR